MDGSQRSPDTGNMEGLKRSLLAQGFEIYRVEANVIVLAERVRMHLMESAVSLRSDEGLHVHVRVRTQRSDFPGDDPNAMFERVRMAVGATAKDKGFSESGVETRDIMHPAEAGTVLDVWHEVTFSKEIDEDTLQEHVRWALALPRCIANDGARQ